ncbi:MAG: hypothetical protein CMH81_03585 [Nitrospiraceae bacterium]|nr:hypothetical protein [Nitrospiraceae bacterium]
MRILMVGAGSVGGFIGAHLAHAGVDVSFLLRPRTYEAVRSRGLTLRSGNTSFTVHPPVATDPSKLATPDVIMLGIKCYDLDQVIWQIGKILKKDTVILTFQNGVDTEERLMATFESHHIVAGIIYIYTKIAEPGVIDHFARGSVTIGELSGNTNTPRITALRDLFAKTPIPCKISRNITKAKWEKMCWNVVFNPLTVLLDDNVAKALDHDDTLALTTDIVKETIIVAEKFGVVLPPETPETVVTTTKAVRNIHTSMFDDWKAGRQTEIEHLNGYLVRHAQTFGVPVPVNETLYRLVKAKMARPSTKKATLHINGQLTTPFTFDRAALARLPTEAQVMDSSTIVAQSQGKGVRLKKILDLLTVDAEADHITFHSSDGKFSASLTLEQARAYGIVIYELDDLPIPIEKGGPFRLTTPGLGDLCANVKHLVRMEITHSPGRDTRPSRVC